MGMTRPCCTVQHRRATVILSATGVSEVCCLRSPRWAKRCIELASELLVCSILQMNNDTMHLVQELKMNPQDKNKVSGSKHMQMW